MGNYLDDFHRFRKKQYYQKDKENNLISKSWFGTPLKNRAASATLTTWRWLLVSFITAFPLLMLPGLFNAFELPKFIALRFFVVLMTLLAGFLVAIRGSVSLKVSPAMTTWIGFLVITLFSSLVSEIRHTAFFGRYPLYLGFFSYTALFCTYLIVNQTADLSVLKVITKVFLLPTGLVSLYAILQGQGMDFGWAIWGSSGRSSATWGTPIALGGFLSFSIVMTLATVLAAESLAWRLAATVVSGAALAALLFSLTRGAWIALVVGLLFFTILVWGEIKQQIKAFIYLALTAFASLSIAIISWDKVPVDIFKHFKFSGESNLSLFGRWHVWKSTAPLLFERPLLGFGLDTYAYHGLVDDKVHNFFMDLAFGAGWPAFILFFSGLLLLLLAGIRIRKNLETPDRVLVSGLVAGLFTLIVHLQFAWATIGIMVIFFFYAGLLESVSRREIFNIRLEGQRLAWIAGMAVIILVFAISVYSVYLFRTVRADRYFYGALRAQTQGDYERQSNSIDEAVYLEPREPYFYEVQAIASYQQLINMPRPTVYDWRVTTAVLQQALEHQPRAPRIYAMLIGLYLEAPEGDGLLQAEEAFLAMLKADPHTRDAADTYISIGRAFASLGTKGLAKTAFLKALELDPGNSEARLELKKL